MGKKRSKDPKCGCSTCEQRVPLAQQLVGKCSKCNGMFCIQHRLPESHQCQVITTMSDEDKKRVAESMRCVATKV